MDDGTIAALSPDAVIRYGGWDPRYARVLLIARDGDLALALVDGNGDGAELEVEYWHHYDGGWHPGASSGYGPLASMAPVNTWNAGELVCALGRGSPGSHVHIAYGDRTYTREANDFGVWGFVHEADSPHEDETPAVGPRTRHVIVRRLTDE
jgi:hypothetical protein